MKLSSHPGSLVQLSRRLTCYVTYVCYAIFITVLDATMKVLLQMLIYNMK